MFSFPLILILSDYETDLTSQPQEKPARIIIIIIRRSEPGKLSRWSRLAETSRAQIFLASRIRLPCLLLGLHTFHTFTLVNIITMIIISEAFSIISIFVIILTFLTRSLPIALIQHGGLAFLFIYLICLTVVGAPLLLLETSLGKICYNTFVCFFYSWHQ